MLAVLETVGVVRSRLTTLIYVGLNVSLRNACSMLHVLTAIARNTYHNAPSHLTGQPRVGRLLDTYDKVLRCGCGLSLHHTKMYV